MKSFAFYLLHALLLVALIGCGKDNESGKGNYTYQSGVNGYGYNAINSPYNYMGQSVNEIINHNPCITGFNQQYRTTIQLPLTGFPTVIAPNEIYAGVTSLGDVALLVGQGAGQPPLFVAYVCQRNGYSTGQGQLLDIALGSYSQCLFKPLTRATMVIPGAVEPLYFRWLDGGTSQRTKFPFCR